MNKKYQ